MKSYYDILIIITEYHLQVFVLRFEIKKGFIRHTGMMGVWSGIYKAESSLLNYGMLQNILKIDDFGSKSRYLRQG